MIIESFGMELIPSTNSTLSISRNELVKHSNPIDPNQPDSYWNNVACDMCLIDYKPKNSLHIIREVSYDASTPIYFTIKIMHPKKKYGFTLSSSNQSLMRYCFHCIFLNKDILINSVKEEFPELFI